MSLKDMFKRKTADEKLKSQRVEIEMLKLEHEKERLKAEIRMEKSKGKPEKTTGEGKPEVDSKPKTLRNNVRDELTMMSDREKRMYHRWKTYSKSDLSSEEQEKMRRWGQEMEKVKAQPKKTNVKHRQQVKTSIRKRNNILDKLFGV